MAKKVKKVEAPIIDAVDINAVPKINIMTAPSANYSILAFGSDFVNFKNYIEDDIEKMKANFYPKIGSIVTDQEGNRYRFKDIRKETLTTKQGAEEVMTDQYIFDLMYVAE